MRPLVKVASDVLSSREAILTGSELRRKTMAELTFSSGITATVRPPARGKAARAAAVEVAPQPTEAPRATKAPKPTQTPQPTEAPTQASGLSPASAAYMQDMGGIVTEMGKALSALGELAQVPKPTSDDWKIDLATQMVIIQQGHQKLSEMDVPEDMTDIHAATLDATSDCDQATRLLTSGLDKGRVADIQRAGALMRQCGEKMTSAAWLVDEYTAAHR
jgi:hypothetical protein